MHHKSRQRLQSLRQSVVTMAGLVHCWVRHEWSSLQGHRIELVERLRMIQQTSRIAEQIHAQWDLLPESRRRLQRNADTRRAILMELEAQIRQLQQLVRCRI